MLSAWIRHDSGTFALALALLLSVVAAQTHAHGALIEVKPTAAIWIEARYDTGAAMAMAQVAVFAPDAPASPWLSGQTDAMGRFSFVPDERAGRWAIQVRQAGHGAIAYGEVTQGDRIAISSTGTAPVVAGLSWAQKLLMLACVLWGATGTALYVLRNRPGAGRDRPL